MCEKSFSHLNYSLTVELLGFFFIWKISSLNI